MFFNNRIEDKTNSVAEMLKDECKRIKPEALNQSGHFSIEPLAFILFCRGCSSVGRAVALQAIGQEFEPPQLHHSECRVENSEL